jgi:hypothetical protein
MNDRLNRIKFTNYNNNSININNDIKKDKQLKNEIICIYNKQENEINLLHDYSINTNSWTDDGKKRYIEGKNNISEKI